jgi:molybdate transport system ATP-binding protein
MSLTLRGRVTFDRFALEIDLGATSGEVVAIVGPNGSGKSTTLGAVAGRHRLSAGVLELDGRVLDEPGTGSWVPVHARGVGYVFQHFELFPHLSTLDNVAYGLRRRGFDRRTARERAQHWLNRMGIGDLALAKPPTLSGGQAQRVALARALAFEPGALLLDEPMSALDVESRMSVRSEVRRLLNEFDGVTLIVTHDPLDMLGLADRVVVLDGGRVAQDDTPEQMRRHPHTRHAATLVGRNVVRGHAQGHRIDLGRGITVTTENVHEGPVDLVCAPRAVRLALQHRDRPPGAWEATIAGLEAVGDHVRALLGPPLRLMARIPLEALTAELALDANVWVWFDLAELEVHPAPTVVRRERGPL